MLGSAYRRGARGLRAARALARRGSDWRQLYQAKEMVGGDMGIRTWSSWDAAATKEAREAS